MAKLLNQHTPRKILHALLGTALVIGVAFFHQLYGLKLVLYLGVFALLIMVLIEVIRIEYRQTLPLYQDLLKKKEKYHFHALIYSFISAIIVLAVFDIRIAIPALLMATFGDPMASVIGRTIGKHKIPFNKSKSIEGTAGNLIICAAIGVFMLYDLRGAGIAIGLIMGLTATTVEFFSDLTEDNFTIPLFTAAVGQFLLWIF